MQVDAIVRPRRTKQLTWTVRDEAAGCFTKCSDHSERARILAIPANQRMTAGAAVTVLEPEVGAGNDVQQSIRWRGVRVVVCGKEVALQVKRHSKCVPVSSRLPRQATTVSTATISRSTFGATGKLHAVRADEGVIRAKVLTKTKCEPIRIRRIDRKAPHTVVRIATVGIANDQLLGLALRFGFLGGVWKTTNEPASAHIEMPVGAKQQIRAEGVTFVENGPLISDAVIVRVFKNQNPIGLRSLIV